MLHVVFFSSGVGSWAAAKRVAEQYGATNLILLFADTLIEDDDNYRFLEEAASNVGGQLVKVADGRTPFEIFKDVKWMGNSRIAQCSHILKQKQCLKWLRENDAEHCAKLYLGIDWSEIHRLKSSQEHWQPWECLAPLTEAPYLDRHQILTWARKEGLTPPRLYDYGFAHANCGGGCVRAGQAHWRHLHKVLPKVFDKWEEAEQNMRDFLQKDVTILRRQKNGRKVNFSLRELRKEIEENRQLDLLDWGGCGCFVDSE